jgi:VanZ family protein
MNGPKHSGKIKLYIYFILALVETIVLFYFSFLPSIETVGPVLWLRPGDMEHLAAYLVYGFLLNGLFSCFIKTRKKALLASIAFGCMVGISCEAIQMFVPTRVADIWDVAADGTGVLAGSVLKTGNFRKAFSR